MDSAVAIIGMGARFPGAPDLAAYRRLLWEGRVERSPVPAERWDHAQVHSANPRHANRTPAQQGAFMTGIADFAPEFFGVTPKRARIMDPQQRLVLEISRQALEDAGYAQRRLAEGNVGVYVGASSSDHRTLIAGAVNIPCDLAGRSGMAPALTPEEFAAVTAALPPIQGYSIVGQQLNMLAANVSQAFDFKGPAFALDTACSSALAALHEAVLHLRVGIVDAALVGGVYVQLDPIMMVCFGRVGAISFTDECRPFQAAADGFVLGEGVGMIVVKRLADAVAAGDRVLAVIRGIGMNNDGQGAGPLTPLASGQVAAMARAWEDADLSPATVGLLEAHGTATPAGDGIELAAMTEFFGGRAAGGVPVTSVKANIGHSLASAGIASLIKATLAVHEGVVPPQPCAGPLRAEFAGAAAWLRVPTAREQWSARGAEPRRAGVSAFGFGGTNVHVVLEQAPAGARREKVTIKREHRCVFSAPSKALLAAYLGQVEEAVRERSVALAGVAFTLAQRRTDRVSTTIVAASAAEFFEKIAARRAALGREESPADDAGGTAEAGALVWLPASPLAERRFWLMDETKRRAAAAAPIRAVAAATEVARVAPLQTVAAAVAAVTAWSVHDVRAEQRFVGDLGFDSLTTLEFMAELEKRLPGLPPPPRTLFTPELTVAQLVATLADFPAVSAKAERAPAVTADWPEVRQLAERKAALVAAGLAMPYFQEHDGRAGAVTRIGGRDFVNFSSYDYLGLAGDPAVSGAAIAAVERYGTSASASRVASGERPVHKELERALANFLGCGDALALVSGHATNVAVIGHLFGPEDLVVHDSLAHDCIVTGARLSGARRLPFPHNDMAALDALLARERPKARRALIAVEGVYSMDGDLAPLAEIVALKRKHDALVLLDEAHSLGVLGATGRGAGEYFSVARGDVDLWMGTLSKTLASCGGYLAGGPELIDYLRFTLPGFVYSVGLSPANAAAALAALRLLAAGQERVGRLRERSDYFRACCRGRGIDIGASADSAVVPAITGDSPSALRLAQALGTRGINVQPIFAPAVEEGKARLRFFVTAEHTEAQLRAAADAVAEELTALRGENGT